MKPVLQAILLADHVYVDKGTGKHVVAGVFDRLLSITDEQIQTQPEDCSQEKKLIRGGMHSGSPWAFISVTDVRGKQVFALRYVFLDEDQLIFETKFTITSDNPLNTHNIVAPLPPLPSDRPGTFALEVVWNDEPLGTHRVVVARAAIGRQDHADS